MSAGPGEPTYISCTHGRGFHCKTCYPATLRALVRLSAAALARDATMGDPIALLNARAELHNANLEAMDAIGQATGRIA